MIAIFEFFCHCFTNCRRQPLKRLFFRRFPFFFAWAFDHIFRFADVTIFTFDFWLTSLTAST